LLSYTGVQRTLNLSLTDDIYNSPLGFEKHPRVIKSITYDESECE